MGALVACADRDFLAAYSVLLSREYGRVAAVFDGTQIPAVLAGGDIAVAVVDRDLPNVTHEHLRELLAAENIAALTVYNPVSGEDTGGEGSLAYPFFPEELLAALRAIAPDAGAEEDDA
ncbi:MAG: hypothetical protein K6C36_00160 [Clostridia bacterium]|nr:hypothetical protein [Clostridia bacterium]